MGAEYQGQPFEACSKKDLAEKIVKVCQQAAYDYGHAGYSGSWAEMGDVDFRSKIFTSDDEAEDYCDEHAGKWDPLLAVRVSKPKLHWYVGG